MPDCAVMTNQTEKKYFQRPVFYTAKALSDFADQEIPDEYNTGKHLIYSSPATLAFNSPGAEGFGVKRAGLAIPGSVMLIVAPGCCGRNTSEITNIPGYRDRFFYLNMDETDLVTGRHLKKIPMAAKEILASLSVKPTVLMICITCVDALLGTDMDRISASLETEIGIPVRPCYMYALTREGRKPPMVQVRESLYSLLKKRKKRGTTVNLMGFFAPLIPEFELYSMLRDIGVKKINELSRCGDMEEFYSMAEANFNLVLNSEAGYAAEMLNKKLEIPYVEMVRLYQTDRIENQYRALAAFLNLPLCADRGRAEAEQAVMELREHFPMLRFAVGEAMNGNPFELALSLVRYGFRVPVIYGNPQPASMVYIRQLAALSADTRIYSNMDPGMLFYEAAENPVDVTIGKDAAYYHDSAVHVMWNSDQQPYGFAGVRKLFQEILAEVS